MDSTLKCVGATILMVAWFTITAGSGLAADKKSTEALAKAAQNPVADLISVPFQDNINFGVGPDDAVQNVLNIQPVIPISIDADWNVITRTILPIISQPALAPGEDRTNGLGDMQFTAFLSPAKASGLIWGVGPVFQFPTNTAPELGTDKWGAGPSAVVLRIDGPWVYGALANNIWSFAGDSSDPDVNQFLLQYFVNYNFPGGWYLSSAPVITANWEASSDDRWTVPVGGGGGRLFHIGKLPVNAQAQAFYNVASPDNGPEWTLRLQLQFLFPR